MIYALKSGLCAAESILKKQDYDMLWKKDFGQELLDGFKRRALMSKMSNKDYEKVVSMEGKVKADHYKKQRAEKMKTLEVKFKEALVQWRTAHDFSKFV